MSAAKGGRLPTAVIGGAPRCGTTSLFTWIVDHPDAAGSEVKETFYLMDAQSTVGDPATGYHAEGLSGYRRCFAAAAPSARVVLEATAGYLYQRTALEVISESLPDTHVLFVLRRPADRLLSTYRYFSNNWTDLDPSVTFEAYVELTRARADDLSHNEFLRDGLAHGRYIEPLRLWRERCGDERLHLIVFEELLRDPRGTLERVTGELGLDPGFYANYEFPRENEAYRVRSHGLQRINQSLRARIPAGGLRRLLRAAYRRLNTSTRRGRPGGAELDALERLDHEYAPWDEALANEFGLDLTAWRRGRRSGR